LAMFGRRGWGAVSGGLSAHGWSRRAGIGRLPSKVATQRKSNRKDAKDAKNAQSWGRVVNGE